MITINTQVERLIGIVSNMPRSCYISAVLQIFSLGSYQDFGQLNLVMRDKISKLEKFEKKFEINNVFLMVLT